MNWARDDVGISDTDFEKVFKYEPNESTVIRMLKSINWTPEIYSQASEKEWYKWIDNKLPSPESNDPGLILILAKRSGEPSLQGIQKSSSEDWIARAKKDRLTTRHVQRADTFAALQEKSTVKAESVPKPVNNGRRGVRTVPYERETFERVTRAFHVHGLIAPVISRADVPIFTCDKVNMAQSAWVYNCRSSNAWEMDLALSVTHYPHCSLTFAILFGCPFSIEEEIITRLGNIREEAAHPLLMPGIFAEIERGRHVRLVEEMGNEVEARIFELDFQTSNLEGPQGSQADEISRAKRTAYLDLAYLRNALVSWNTELGKMVGHSRKLMEEEYYNLNTTHSQMSEDNSRVQDLFAFQVPEREERDSRYLAPEEAAAAGEEQVRYEGVSPTSFMMKMRTTSQKIEDRLLTLRDEYNDKIRDCSMRVEGMAMATQWSHGETNVEIALATNRDSRHMRSIALVTMIFLPGTFFASMFSMTFFNWSSDTPMVSTYVWIYVLITVVFTALTIGIWYYIVVYRPRRARAGGPEKWFAKYVGYVFERQCSFFRFIIGRSGKIAEERQVGGV